MAIIKNQLAKKIFAYANKVAGGDDEFIQVWEKPEDIEWVVKNNDSIKTKTGWDAYVQCGETWGFLINGSDVYYVGGDDDFEKERNWKKTIDDNLEVYESNLTNKINKYLNDD